MKKIILLLSFFICVYNAGYSQVYTVTSIPYALIAGVGTAIPLGDDVTSGMIPIGFTFNFYGTPYTQLDVSSNGFLSFSPGMGNGCCSGQTLPTPFATTLIAFSWDDMYTIGGTVNYLVSGTFPNRIFVLNYNNVGYCCSPANMATVQIQLYETTGEIKIMSANNIHTGRTATMGIQDFAISSTAVPGRNAASWNSPINDGQLFTPPPPPEMDVLGNGISIVDGDASPDLADDTDFGNVVDCSDSVSKTYTIENTGLGDLIMNGTPKVVVGGVNASDFVVTTQPTSPVLPLGITTFTVVFDPSAIGLRSATLSITNNDGNENPYNFSIQGTGIADNIPPVLTCPGNITVDADPGVCSTVVTYTPPVGLDNCGFGVGTQTFNYTGALQTWTVPVGVTSVTIDAYGAAGFGISSPGGLGGYISGTLTVTPGQTLNIYVGGAGTSCNAGGYNGGANTSCTYTNSGMGGGATDIRIGGITLGDRVIVAGGGGGSGYNCGVNDNGGAGGGLTGGTGVQCSSTTGGGVGGDQLGGGAGGVYSGWTSGLPGTFGNGGLSGTGTGGGGGGGGYYGGGGGCWGGGGGGSSWITSFGGGLLTNTPGVKSGNGQLIINYTYSIPTTTVLTSGLPSGSTFPVGVTTETYTATDFAGNVTTCSFDITVADIEAPVPDVANLPDLTAECTVTAVAPTATDNCFGTVTATTIDSLTYNTQGNYTITWTYDDGNGNTTTQTQNVVIADVTAPVADVANLPDLTDECTITAVAPTATDNCLGTVTATTLDSLTYNTQGNFTITWTYDDGNGNTTTQTQNVVIADTTAPIFTCPSNFTTCAGTSLAISPTAVADNCLDTVTVTYTLTGATTASGTLDASGEVFNAGVTTVTYTFDDGNGNTANCAFDVTINTVDTAVTVNQQTLTAVNSDSYQWYNCNTSAIIPGAISISYTAIANGSYAVIVTQNGCIDTSSCHIINGIGIIENSINSNLTIYPNPTNGELTLVLDEATKVEIFDALGNMVIIESYSKGVHNLSLNLADGVYMLKATNERLSRNLKLVIQK